MAYSDYGGYAFRNGEHIEERSDAVLDKCIKSSPGIYPGFVGINMIKPNGHAILGDGPIFVILFKQSSIGIYRVCGPRQDEYEKFELLDLVSDDYECIGRYTGTDGKDVIYFDNQVFTNKDFPAVFTLDGHRIEAYWKLEDNHYLYVRLQQPNGVVWHGWSGYGVGAGFEDGGYGYNNEDRNETMKSLWPEDFV